jgi:hypothetical protein
MIVRNHPKIVDWPPQPGGTNVTAEHPQAASQAILKNVHPVRGRSFPLTCTFKGNEFTYDVQTKDETFARKLAAEFSKKIASTLEQLGDLDIDF